MMGGMSRYKPSSPVYPGPRAPSPSRQKQPARVRGAIAMNNERAPLGWVEIQRDDERKMFETDEDAARAVVLAAGMPRTAKAHGVGASADLADVDMFGDLDTLKDEYGRELHPDEWIVVVPAVAAWRAGIISFREMCRAHREET